MKTLGLINTESVGVFHTAFRFPLLIAQCFGFYPIQGILDADYRSLKFKWIHWRVAYSLLTISTFAFIFGVYVHHHNTVGLGRMGDFSVVMIHFHTMFTSMIFFKLAIDWPMLVTKWYKLENAMRHYEIQDDFKKQIRNGTLYFLIATLSLQIFLIVLVLCNVYRRDGNITAENYYKLHFDVFFTYFDYALWKGFLLQFIYVQKYFIISFLDLFIILITLAVNFRLKQITKKAEIDIKRNESLSSALTTWQTLREDYIKLYNLKNDINGTISWMILLSFTVNMIDVLLQLFETLHPIPNPIERFYFYTSFAFVIVRLVSVCLYCGQIYEQSLKLVTVLSKVPSNSYNWEVERFQNFLTCTNMMLSGKNFFTITKSMLLKIAGAIVTYELVLIQFNIK